MIRSFATEARNALALRHRRVEFLYVSVAELKACSCYITDVSLPRRHRGTEGGTKNVSLCLSVSVAKKHLDEKSLFQLFFPIYIASDS